MRKQYDFSAGKKGVVIASRPPANPSLQRTCRACGCRLRVNSNNGDQPEDGKGAWIDDPAACAPQADEVIE